MTTDAMTEMLAREDVALLDELVVEGLTPVAPPAALRAQILSVVKATPQRDETVPGDHESRTLRSDEGKWSPIAPGVRMKRLSKDAARRTVTCLLELEPNAIAPAHDHAGTEDTFVVRGSCRIGSLGLAIGDFHHVEAGAHHGDLIASAEGCLLLITFGIEEAA